MTQNERNEQITKHLTAVEALLSEIHPDRQIRLTRALGRDYDTSDWNRHYMGIMQNDEYIFVSDAATGELYYAVCISCDSTLTAIAELMDLLSRKF